MFMKIILLLWTSLVLWNNTLYAETKVFKNDSVKALVEQVKKAAPSERRVLMNTLKVKLRSMHSEMRKKVMLDLRHSFNKKHTQSHAKGINTHMSHQNTMMTNEAKNMHSHMQTDMMNDMKKPMLLDPHPMPMERR